MDFKIIQPNDRPRHRYISENAIEGISVTKQHVWVSHTKFMFFLNLETLKMEHQCQQNNELFIGSLTYSKDTDIVLSAHLGGTVVSAWNTDEETHMYDIDTREVLLQNETNRYFNDYDAIMTCMTPVLDTVWVGMATGHIMVFHDEELMYFVRPYKEYIRYLVSIPCEGPTGKEKCMVVSGAKSFNSPVPSCPVEQPEFESGKEPSIGQSGVMILWEAFTGKCLRQMKRLEDEGHSYLKNHRKVQTMISQLKFVDGTHVKETSQRPTQTKEQPPRPKMPDRTKDVESSFIHDDGSRNSMITQSMCGSDTTVRDSYGKFEVGSPEIPYTIPTESFIECLPKDEDEVNDELSEETAEVLKPLQLPLQLPVRPRGRSSAIAEETFDVEVSDKLSVCILCPKPAQLERLMNELKNEGNGLATVKKYNLVYQQSDSGEVMELNSQEKLDKYLGKVERPKLVLMLNKL